MTKLSDLGPPVKGRRHDADPGDERDCFHLCKVCGQPVDMRDLRQMMWHERPWHEWLKPEIVRDI
ncbi:hypothetical protein [Mesorhizobium sp. Cs1321R2N1]|uniref:hypothetical protein n=1 Tax=Mesorhizobium sp. Cs1321R2N1 TaxID=3015174 RepID=UPI00301E2F4B